MKIRTLWQLVGPHDGPPWLVASVDEYTEKDHGCTPDFYQAELDKHTAIRRELIIEIPDSTVGDLFQTPVTQAMAAYPPKEDEEK
jgi:hypothetical protein